MNTKIIKSVAQCCGFYDVPLYRKGEDKPDYYDLFNWSCFCGKDDLLCGSLKEELFDTIDKKIVYLQGVFENPVEGYGIIHGENWIQFANSHNKVERCKKWLNEIACFIRDKKGINFNAWGIGGVVSHYTEYYVPVCHTIRIYPEVVTFIQNYKSDLNENN